MSVRYLVGYYQMKKKRKKSSSIPFAYFTSIIIIYLNPNQTCYGSIQNELQLAWIIHGFLQNSVNPLKSFLNNFFNELRIIQISCTAKPLQIFTAMCLRVGQNSLQTVKNGLQIVKNSLQVVRRGYRSSKIFIGPRKAYCKRFSKSKLDAASMRKFREILFFANIFAYLPETWCDKFGLTAKECTTGQCLAQFMKL